MGNRSNKNIRIKIEGDHNPPTGFKTEEKLALRPYSFYVKCFDLPSLFAGKMYALLFRKCENRGKGRDWFDMEWYIRQGISLNIEHFLEHAQDSGDWQEPTISIEELLNPLQNEIEATSIDKVKADVCPFVRNLKQLEIRSLQYFQDLVKLMKVEG